MNDTEIIKFVNSLRLRCPKCDASVTITGIYKDKVDLDHYLPIVGENVRSADVKCAIYDGEVRKLVNAARAEQISQMALKETLIDLSQKP